MGGHAVHWGRVEIHTEFWWGNPTVTYIAWETQRGGRVVLKCVFGLRVELL